MSDEINTGTDEVPDEWAAAMEEQGAPDNDIAPDSAPGVPEPSVAAAPIPDLQEELGSNSGAPDIESILDIPVTLSIEIGRTKISIRNLLQLNQGSVVELDRLAGEPLDVMINGTLVAHGEVVVVNEKFGIRLTDVISAHERVKKLR